MRILMFLLFIAASSPALAQEQSIVFSRAAIDAAVGHSMPAAGRTLSSAQQRQQQRRWVVRHPALFGALMGAAIGGTLGYATHEEDIPPHFFSISRRGSTILGASLGATLGVTTGFVAGLFRD